MPKNVQVPGLSERSERVIQRAAVLAVAILAISAAVLSFSGLLDLAVSSGIDKRLAWLLPVLVDGMVLTGSHGVVAAGLVGEGT
jgi:hypothetical protein